MKIAVVDIGTNSVRMMVVRNGCSVEVEDSRLITTRLGEGLAATGCLSEKAIERTINALAEFKKGLDEQNVVTVLPIATSAVREASNKGIFLEKIHSELGWGVEVIPGEEEAALGFRGVVEGLPAVPDKPLVIDIGGGSTELIWRSEGRVNYTSTKAGAVRMSEESSTREQIADLFRPVLLDIGRQEGLSAVGIGGTVTTLAAIDQELDSYQSELVHGYNMPLKRIREIGAKLAVLDLKERQLVKGLQPQRADIILAGISILEVILSELNLSNITTSETDILLGRALKYFEDKN